MKYFNTLKHNGILFPPFYEYKELPIIINNKKYILSYEAEEIAMFWAKKLNTDYIKDKTFVKNFWKDFKTYLPKELQNTKFPEEWNFSYYIKEIEKQKEKIKNRTKEDRKKIKEEKEKLKEQYGYVFIDNKKEPILNYMVEPPSIFLGRGKHPLRGKIKLRIYPEDVILNITSKPPKLNKLYGIKNITPAIYTDITEINNKIYVILNNKLFHITKTGKIITKLQNINIDFSYKPDYIYSYQPKWGGIEFNPEGLYIAKWKLKFLNVNINKTKYILFSPKSTYRQNKEKEKFDKAQLLIKNFNKILKYIDKHLISEDKKIREIATVAKLIAVLGIRVGDEKDSLEADTVGASTLRKEHIKILSNNQVEFKFLGKDSILFHKIIKLDNNTINNIKKALKNKNELFPNTNSQSIKEFLSNANIPNLPVITAKMFRTAIATSIIQNKLQNAKSLYDFINANLEVAKKLNHQSAVPKTYNKTLNNLKEKLKKTKQQLKNKKNEKEQKLNELKQLLKNSKRQKLIKKRIKTTKEKYNKQIKRLIIRKKDLELRIELKKLTKGINLNTSKTNYIDPRVIYSWAKENDINIKKIYNKNLLEKFNWIE